jgi:hypothetical protein
LPDLFSLQSVDIWMFSAEPSLLYAVLAALSLSQGHPSREESVSSIGAHLSFPSGQCSWGQLQSLQTWRHFLHSSQLFLLRSTTHLNLILWVTSSCVVWLVN